MESDPAITNRSATALCVATLYSLIFLPVWDTALVSVAALTALVIAVRDGALTRLKPHFQITALLWGLLVAVNVASAAYPGRALTGGVHILRGLAMLLPVALLFSYSTRAMRLKTLQSLILFSTVIAAGLLITVSGSADTYRALEAIAARHTGNLHNLANLAAFSLLAALVTAVFVQPLRDRLLMLLCVGIQLWLLVWLESEGSWLALLVTLGAVVALYRHGLLRWLALCGVITTVAALHLFYFEPELAHQWTGLTLPTLIERSHIYAALLDAWQQSPWFGWGMHSYKHLAAAQVDGRSFLYPHHIYLEALFSLGIVGLILLTAMLLSLMRFLDWQQVRREPVSLLAFLLLSYFLAKGMTDMKFFSAQSFSLMVFCLGLMSRIPIAEKVSAQEAERSRVGSS